MTPTITFVIFVVGIGLGWIIGHAHGLDRGRR